MKEKDPKERSQCEACPKCETVIGKPFPGIAKKEIRQASCPAEAKDEQDNERNEQAKKTKRPFPKQDGNDHNKRTIHRPKENGRRERVTKKIVARGMVNWCLHGLLHTPLPERPNDKNACESRQRYEK